MIGKRLDTSMNVSMRLALRIFFQSERNVRHITWNNQKLIMFEILVIFRRWIPSIIVRRINRL